MVRWLSLISAVSFLALSPAAAQSPVDAARDALSSGDFGALETILGDANENALSTRDFSELRGLYETLFVTANSTRLKQQEGWLAAAPDSAFAAAALGWSHMHLAGLARGPSWARFTPEEAMAAHREELAHSLGMAERALSDNPDFVPALDLAIALATFAGGQFAVPAMVEKTLAQAPDTHAFALGVNALSPKWGGDIEKQVALCKLAKKAIAGFDDDTCLVWISYSEDLRGPVRKKAAAALERKDDPSLDFARARAYLAEWRNRPEAHSEAKRLVMESIRPAMAVINISRSINMTASAFWDQPFRAEANAAFIAALKERQRDNPEDYEVLRPLLSDLITRKGPGYFPDEAAALWRTMLIRGAFNADVWAAGRQMEAYRSNVSDPAAVAPYLINQIYYSHHSPIALAQYVDLGLLRFLNRDLAASAEPFSSIRPDDIEDVALLCSVVRAQRLYEATCENAPPSTGCNDTGRMVPDIAGSIRQLLSGTNACLREQSAPLDELLFQPVPISYFITDKT